MESMMECQMLRQQGGTVSHPPPGHPRAGPNLPLPMSMFRPTRAPEPTSAKMTPEERFLIARSQLLRAQSPFPVTTPSSPSPFSPISGLSPIRPPQVQEHLSIGFKLVKLGSDRLFSLTFLRQPLFYRTK